MCAPFFLYGRDGLTPSDLPVVGARPSACPSRPLPAILQDLPFVGTGDQDATQWRTPFSLSSGHAPVRALQPPLPNILFPTPNTYKPVAFLTPNVILLELPVRVITYANIVGAHLRVRPLFQDTNHQ
jgi:hypothetical protein